MTVIDGVGCAFACFAALGVWNEIANSVDRGEWGLGFFGLGGIVMWPLLAVLTFVSLFTIAGWLLRRRGGQLVAIVGHVLAIVGVVIVFGAIIGSAVGG